MAEKQNNISGSNGLKENYKKDRESNDNIVIIKSSRNINKNDSNLSNNNNNHTYVYHDTKNNIELKEDIDYVNNLTVSIPGSVEPSKNEEFEDIILDTISLNAIGYRGIPPNISIPSGIVGSNKTKVLQNDLQTIDTGAASLIKPDVIRKTSSLNEHISQFRRSNEESFLSLSSTRMKRNIEMSTTGLSGGTTIKIQKLSATSSVEYQEKQVLNNTYESHSHSIMDNIVTDNNEVNEEHSVQNENVINTNFTTFNATTNTASNTNDAKQFLYNTRTGTGSMNSVGSIICRICHNNDPLERLISPCLCKGTLAYVHRHCLEHWLSRAGILHCELCMYRFQTQHTLRYGCWESIRIWFRHPNNRGLLQSDFLVCSLLTIVTFGLITISALGMQNFLQQSNHMIFSKFWTQGSVFLFLCIVMSAYGVNVYMIVKGQTVPWFRWWRSARHVRLILTDSTPADRVQQEQRTAERQRLLNTQLQQQAIIVIPEEPIETSIMVQS